MLNRVLSFLLIFNFYVFSQLSRAESINYTKLDEKQGFAFNPSNQNPFGYVVGLKVGKLPFNQDFAVKNPISNQKMSVFGVLSALYWTAAAKDPIMLRFYLSPANVQRLSSYIRSNPSETTAEVDFQMYAFDPGTKKYYAKVRSFTLPVKGILNRIGHQLPEMEDKSYPLQTDLFQNKGLTITFDKNPVKLDSGLSAVVAQWSLYPTSKKQAVVFAKSPEKSLKLNWGKAEK